jgi:hypothetical protein
MLNLSFIKRYAYIQQKIAELVCKVQGQNPNYVRHVRRVRNVIGQGMLITSFG